MVSNKVGLERAKAGLCVICGKKLEKLRRGYTYAYYRGLCRKCAKKALLKSVKITEYKKPSFWDF